MTDAAAVSAPDSTNGFPVVSFLEIEGRVLSGEEFEEYCKDHGLCRRCANVRTHRRVIKLFGRGKKWEPMTLHDEETGEYSVYKGYCLKPTCYTLGQAKRLTGETGTKDSKDKRRKKLKMKMLKKSEKNRPERRKTRADPETGSIMSTMDDDMSIMSGLSEFSGISNVSGRSSRSSGLSGIASSFRKKKKRRGSGSLSLGDSVSNFTDFSDDDTIDTTQTPMPLKPVVPGEVNPIISQRLEQLVKHDYFAVLDMTKVELRPEDVDAIVEALPQAKTLDTIVLNKCRLRDDGLIKIANALEKANHVNIRSFSCRQNRIGNKGVTALSFLFSKSETLETLDLSENSISSKGAANILSAFSSNPKPVLNNLNLSQNEIWDMDDGSFLRSNTTLKTFNLDGNFMHDEGAEQIANAIAANKQSVIEKLYLGWNGISDDGAVALARMMEANETLQVLGLAENDISNTGARAILSALAINTSVREISGLYHNQIDRKFIIVAIKRLLHRYGERTGQAPPAAEGGEEDAQSQHSENWAQQIYSDERHFDEKEEEQEQGPSIALEAIEHWDWGTFGIEEIEASRGPQSAVMPDVPPTTEVEPAAVEEPAPAEEPVEDTPELPIDRLTVFQSAPLAYFDRKTSEHHAIPIFDFQYEADAIEDALADHEEIGGAIELNVENVTAGRFKVSFLQGTSPIMHFSGNGHEDCVALENGFGYMQALPNADLKRFVKNGEGKVKVVVLHTCHARSMAEAFIEAGVPHVVCCHRENTFRDEGPIEFAQAFYRALAGRKTLQQAFNEGVDMVKRSSNVKVTGNIADQYCLLPEKPADDPYHNVEVFYQRPMPKLSAPPEVYSPPLPLLPEQFVGREVDMYEVLESLRVDDVVRVGGAPGCGKASVISAVGRYILERPKSFKIDSIYWLPAPKGLEDDEDNQVYDDLCYLIDMTVNAEDQIWEEPEFAVRRDRVTAALAEMRTILVIDGRMFTTEASGENLEMLLTHLLNEVSMKIVLLTAMEASKSSKTKTSRQEETMVNIGPLDLKSSALLFGSMSEVISRSGNPIVHTAEEFADCIVPPSIAKLASSGEKKIESSRSQRLYEILGSGNPTEICNLAAAFTEIDLRNLLRFAKRPEIQVESGSALEEEIQKYTALKKKAVDGKNYARAYDFTDAIEELESLRPKFPNVDDLATKEAEYKEKFKKYLKMKKYNEANAIKRKILELKKTALREKHAKSEAAKNSAAALSNGDSDKAKKNFYEMDKLFATLRLDEPISAKDTSGTLTDNSGEATLKIPRVGGFCNLNITMGSVFDLAYEDGSSGVVYWTNECCDMEVDEAGRKILEAGGESFQTAMQSLDVQATTDWGPVKCPTGEAVGIGPLTFSGLEANFVFLAVGPLSPSNDDIEWDHADLNGIQILETEIRASYRSSLQLIAQTGVNDVGVPTLTSNPTGNAYERTLWIGLKTIIEEAKSTELRSIDLCTASHQEANLLLKMALGLGLSV